MQLTAGSTLQAGKYLLNHPLEAQGFGITYRGTQTIVNQPVVVKTLHPGLQKSQAFVRLRERFIAITRLLAKSQHPNIVRVLDFFQEGELPFLVMEYVPGLTFTELIAQHRTLPDREALHHIRQLGAALSVAHRYGLVHGNLKPQNLICRNGTQAPVLVGFGISAEKMLAQVQYAVPGFPHAFNAPEQIGPLADRTPSADIYGLAAMLYYLVSGHPPMPAQQRPSADRLEQLPMLSLIHPTLQKPIVQGMALSPQQRPQTIEGWLHLLPGAPLGIAKPEPIQLPTSPPRGPQASARPAAALPSVPPDVVTAPPRERAAPVQLADRPTAPPDRPPVAPPHLQPDRQPAARSAAPPDPQPHLQPPAPPELRPHQRPTANPTARPSARPTVRPAVRPAARRQIPAITPEVRPDRDLAAALPSAEAARVEDRSGAVEAVGSRRWLPTVRVASPPERREPPQLAPQLESPLAPQLEPQTDRRPESATRVAEPPVRQADRPVSRGRFFPKALALTGLIAATLGFGFGLALKFNAAKSPMGSGIFHAGQSFPPKPWKGTLTPVDGGGDSPIEGPSTLTPSPGTNSVLPSAASPSPAAPPGQSASPANRFGGREAEPKSASEELSTPLLDPEPDPSIPPRSTLPRRPAPVPDSDPAPPKPVAPRPIADPIKPDAPRLSGEDAPRFSDRDAARTSSDRRPAPEGQRPVRSPAN
jgi:serine/threonine protein kinase